MRKLLPIIIAMIVLFAACAKPVQGPATAPPSQTLDTPTAVATFDFDAVTIEYDTGHSQDEVTITDPAILSELYQAYASIPVISPDPSVDGAYDRPMGFPRYIIQFLKDGSLAADWYIDGGGITAGSELGQGNRVIANGRVIYDRISDVFSSAQAPAAFTGPSRTFTLENPTDRQKLERLLSITLNDDGTALLATPPISDYALPKCAYTVENGELLIRAVIDNSADEEFYGVKNGDIIARFKVVDNNTLLFESSTVLLYADTGAQYVYDPASPAPDAPSYAITYSGAKGFIGPSGYVDAAVIFEITNTGDTNLRLLPSKYDLVYAVGNPIAINQLITAYPQVIAPGEKAYYYADYLIIGQEQVQVLMASLLYPVVSVTDAPAIRLDIPDASVYTGTLDALQMRGTVKNDTGQDVDNLCIAGVLFDGGNPLAVVSADLNKPLAAGDSLAFDGNELMQAGIYFGGPPVTYLDVPNYTLVAFAFPSQ